VGNLLLVFHFPIRSGRRRRGNVGISPAFGEISQGLVERGESLLLAFHAFHSPAISTALFSYRGCRHRVSSVSFAFCIRRAASVSLTPVACRCSISAVTPVFRYCFQSFRDISFS
jgi:hypothetical protein